MYAIQFRKRDGINTFGRTIWAQGCFWSPTPYNVGAPARVTNNQFSIPLDVEALQSTLTGKGPNDFSSFEANGVK